MCIHYELSTQKKLKRAGHYSLHQKIVIFSLALMALVHIKVRLVMVLDVSLRSQSRIITYAAPPSISIQPTHIEFVMRIFPLMAGLIILQLIFGPVCEMRPRRLRHVVVDDLRIERDMLRLRGVVVVEGGLQVALQLVVRVHLRHGRGGGWRIELGCVQVVGGWVRRDRGRVLWWRVQIVEIYEAFDERVGVLMVRAILSPLRSAAHV